MKCLGIYISHDANQCYIKNNDELEKKLIPYPKKETVKKLKNTFFNFLLGKRERIKRNTLIGKQE
jgi:hypothetical protein